MFKRDKHLQTETEIISPGLKTRGRGEGVWTWTGGVNALTQLKVVYLVKTRDVFTAGCPEVK